MGWLWWLLIGMFLGKNNNQEKNDPVVTRTRSSFIEIPDENTECSDLYKQVVKNRGYKDQDYETGLNFLLVASMVFMTLGLSLTLFLMAWYN